MSEIGDHLLHLNDSFSGVRVGAAKAATERLLILELASNGFLRANVHRVVSPPDAAERLSIAFFLGARLDATVPVLDLAPELAAEAGGLTQDPLNPLFHEVGRNYLKGRLRSHPDVAQRHHADLLDPPTASCTSGARLSSAA